MAEQKVSYRYAKAILDTAKSEGQEERVYEDFRLVNLILKYVPELMSIAKKPLISSLRKKKLYNEIFSEKVSQLTLNFFLFLVDKDRDYLIPSIIKQYERLYFELKNILPVEIFLARDFDDELKNKLVKKLEETTGKKVIPRFIIDPKIIGGFKIKIEDWVFDTTLKNKLDSLYQELVSNIKVN